MSFTAPGVPEVCQNLNKPCYVFCYEYIFDSHFVPEPFTCLNPLYYSGIIQVGMPTLRRTIPELYQFLNEENFRLTSGIPGKSNKSYLACFFFCFFFLNFLLLFYNTCMYFQSFIFIFSFFHKQRDRNLTKLRGYKTFFMLNSAEHEICLLINIKLLTIANSFLRNIAEHENFSANKYENANCCWHFHIH